MVWSTASCGLSCGLFRLVRSCINFGSRNRGLVSLGVHDALREEKLRDSNTIAKTKSQVIILWTSAPNRSLLFSGVSFCTELVAGHTRNAKRKMLTSQSFFRKLVIMSPSEYS